MLNRRQFIKVACAMGLLPAYGGRVFRAQDEKAAPVFEWMDTFAGVGKAHSVVLDSQGALYASIPGRYCIRKYQLHRGSWTEDRAFALAKPRPGAADGLLNFPTGITVTQRDDLLVSDTNNGRLQMFNAAGGHALTIGKPGNQQGEFLMPLGLCYISHSEDKGTLWVADSRNHRVQRYVVVYRAGSALVDYTGEFPVTDDALPENILAYGESGHETVLVREERSVMMKTLAGLQATGPLVENQEEITAWVFAPDKSAAVLVCEAQVGWVRLIPARNGQVQSLTLTLPKNERFAIDAVALGRIQQREVLACLDRREGRIHVFQRRPE